MDNGRVVIRPVSIDDLNIVCAFGEEAGVGFTSLVNNRTVMRKKIEKSIESFEASSSHSSKLFFFVMEFLDPLTNQKKIIGTCAIDAPQASSSVAYNYKIETLAQISQNLKVNKQHDILSLSTHYQTMSHFTALFLNKDFRGAHRGEFLSRVRCLFIAAFPDFFSDTLYAQMRGLLDENNNSIFWESLGRYFLDMSLKDANYLRVCEGEHFVKELMPTHPVYIELLPKECQKIIGEPHRDSRSALHLLEQEGFKNRGFVDVFDAGPVVEVNKAELKTRLESTISTIHSLKKISTEMVPKMISNTHLAFRATMGSIECIEPGLVSIDEEVAAVLNVNVGDKIRFCDLHKHPWEQKICIT